MTDISAVALVHSVLDRELRRLYGFTFFAIIAISLSGLKSARVPLFVCRDAHSPGAIHVIFRFSLAAAVHAHGGAARARWPLLEPLSGLLSLRVDGCAR